MSLSHRRRETELWCILYWNQIQHWGWKCHGLRCLTAPERGVNLSGPTVPILTQHPACQAVRVTALLTQWKSQGWFLWDLFANKGQCRWISSGNCKFGRKIWAYCRLIMSVGWDMECHFSEYRIKKKKKKEKAGGRQHAICLLWYKIAPEEESRGFVCVCTDTPPQQETFCRLLLYDLQLSSYVPPLAPPPVNENLANSSPPPTIPQPSASPITPLTILRGARWHFNPLAEPLWLGYSCVEPGRVGQPLSGLRLDLNPFFCLKKAAP